MKLGSIIYTGRPRTKNGLSSSIGKPEPLKHRKAWSRRIDQNNRLIYNFDEKKNLLIIACKGHYDD
jgi:toxin YoeB